MTFIFTTSKSKFFGCWSIKVFVIFAVLVSFTQVNLAKTLKEYKSNIEHLKSDFSLIASAGSDAEFDKEVFEEIVLMLPDQETIDVFGADLEVNNTWIADEVEKYKEKTEEKEKRQIARGISEQLEAIELLIYELEESSQRSVTKDEEKQKLAEILKREEFQKTVNEEKSLIDRFLVWLDKLLKRQKPAQPKKLPPSGNFGQFAYFLQFVLYGAIIAIIGFLIYKFAPFFISKIRNREHREKKQRIILGEKIGSNETSANLFNDAENLALNGNLRDAIRKGYIAFLFELSERKLIGLAKHKTNRDYLRSVRKKRELFKNMSGLTNNYERHWYGFEDAEMDDWEDFRNNYKEALDKS